MRVKNGPNIAIRVKDEPNSAMRVKDGPKVLCGLMMDLTVLRGYGLT